MTVISPDAYLINEEGEYEWSPPRAKAAWDSAYDALKEALADDSTEELVLMCGIPGAGKSTWLQNHRQEGVVYFDATFTNRRARKGVIRFAQEFGVPYSILVLNTPLSICSERNDTRTPDRRVPDAVMDRMQGSLLRDLPTKWEGFDEIVVEGNPLGFAGKWCWIKAAVYSICGRIFNSPYWQFMPTWMWEAHFAALTLFFVFVSTTDLTGDPHQALVNAVAGLAVFFTFQYLSVSFRLLEAQEKQNEVTVQCYQKLPYYLWAKESLWMLVFLLTGAYTAIVGNVLFLVYPGWRKFYLRCKSWV